MAAAPPPETALSAPGGSVDEEDEDQCRICHFPAEADRPLRYPCACRGSIKFVHDDCLLRWLTTSRQTRCEVCKRNISICPLYAPNAPARLPVSEFMVGLTNKLMGWIFLLLCLAVSICVWEFVMPLTTLWTWRLALSRSFAQVRHLLSIRFSTSSIFRDGLYSLRFMPSADTIFACVSVRRAFVRELGNYRQRNGLARIAADAVAPLALCVAHLETRLQNRFGGMDTLQMLALHTVEAALMVVLADVVLACIFGFIPLSLGRMLLWLISVFNFGNMDEVDSYTSTASILLTGYGFIFSLGIVFAGVHTFHQYSRGDRLVITILFEILTDGIYLLLSPLRRLLYIHVMIYRIFSLLLKCLRGMINLIVIANISLNFINAVIMVPLFFGCLLDICTSKMFGATMSQRFKLLCASSFASTTLHWLTGCIFLMLRVMLSSLLCPILRPGVSIPFLHTAEEQKVKLHFHEPFYIFYFKKLPRLFVTATNVAMVILLPVQIADRLAPKLFPLDITYFNPPTKDSSSLQAPRYYAELLSGVLLLRFIICNTLKYHEPGALVEKVLQYWFDTTAHALGLSDLLIVRPDGAGGNEVGDTVAPKDQCGSSDEEKFKRIFVSGRMMLLVALAWLTVVIINSALLIFPISVGRAFLFVIPQLPVAGGLKSNDLFAFVVGWYIISTSVVASRESFAYMISGRTRLLASVICKWGIAALKSSPLVFNWVVIIPILVGLLVDLLLISPFILLIDFLLESPFIGPDGGVPVLDLYCTWLLGLLLLKFWTKLAHWTRDAPFLAYFIDKSWDGKLTRAKEDGLSGLRAMWILQDILMPITVNLLAALGIPYVLAKGVFPRFGYSGDVNTAVYHLAWLGSLVFCVLCHLAKVVCRAFVKLHDSIRDERYLIGQRLQNYADNS